MPTYIHTHTLTIHAYPYACQTNMSPDTLLQIGILISCSAFFFLKPLNFLFKWAIPCLFLIYFRLFDTVDRK